MSGMDEARRELLAELYKVTELGDSPEVVVGAVLASGWLAAHDARVRAEALAPIEALAAALTLSGAVYFERERLLGDLRAAMEAKG
jgi:hypothetical protein